MEKKKKKPLRKQEQTSSPFCLTTKHCFTGPISENISASRSFEAVAGSPLTKRVWAGMTACCLPRLIYSGLANELLLRTTLRCLVEIKLLPGIKISGINASYRVAALQDGIWTAVACLHTWAAILESGRKHEFSLEEKRSWLPPVVSGWNLLTSLAAELHRSFCRLCGLAKTLYYII